ncbi:hypothetical protein M9458_036382, partial [Cirrhinus mrigala]
MEPESGEPEETTLESEMFVKSEEVKSEEAILQPLQVLQEPIMNLQEMNITEKEDEETAEDKEDEDGPETKNKMDNKLAEEMMSTDAPDSSSDPTNEPISSNSHTSPPETIEADIEDIRKLTKTPSFGKTVRFMEIEAVEERDSSVDTLFPDFEIEEWTTTSFEELFVADNWKDIT